jgi:hypothetical protein
LRWGLSPSKAISGELCFITQFPELHHRGIFQLVFGEVRDHVLSFSIVGFTFLVDFALDQSAIAI